MDGANKSAKKQMPPLQSVRILGQLRERIRYLHCSLGTEEAHVHWARAFIRFHGLRHPREMGKAEIEAFLMALVSKRNVSSSTHRQALSSLLFLYGKVLSVDLPWLEGIGRPREVKRLPITLSPDEVMRIFHQMDGEFLLIAQLLYGTGLRILEAMRQHVTFQNYCAVAGAIGARKYAVGKGSRSSAPWRVHARCT